MSQITDEESYEAAFSRRIVDDSKWREKALGYALDIRKFEIELYWKRATYFWTLLAASFAGYFALENEEPGKRDVFSIFVVACIGLVLSFAWYLVNRGSKYWQENWERHVDVLAEKVVGPLYRTTLARGPWWFVLKPQEAFPFSVSRVNQTVSLFVTVLWFGLVLRSFPYPLGYRPFRVTPFSVMGTFTAVFMVLLVYLGWPKAKPRSITFDTADFSSATGNLTVPSATGAPSIGVHVTELTSRIDA